MQSCNIGVEVRALFHLLKRRPAFVKMQPVSNAICLYKYPYHNKIKRRISRGELLDDKFVAAYRQIKTCLLSYFKTEPAIEVYYETGPMTYICSMVGVGLPPSFSKVMAKAWTFPAFVFFI